MITETTPAIIAENIPEELTQRPQWVCWRYEERDGKLTKVPYQPNGRRASCSDLMTWSTFEECFAKFLASQKILAVEKDRGIHFEATGKPVFDGIGFVFCNADPYAGIDLDKCRDPETGEIEPWAQKILGQVPEGYIEVSPSGRGLHIFTEGAVRGGGMRKGRVEMYSQGRYFTVTGRQP